MGLSVACACGLLAVGLTLSRHSGLCELNECGLLDGGWDGRGRGCMVGFEYNVLVRSFGRGLIHVLCCIGLEVWRSNLPSTAATWRILHLRVRTWGISLSALG